MRPVPFFTTQMVSTYSVRVLISVPRRGTCTVSVRQSRRFSPMCVNNSSLRPCLLGTQCSRGWTSRGPSTVSIPYPPVCVRTTPRSQWRLHVEEPVIGTPDWRGREKEVGNKRDKGKKGWRESQEVSRHVPDESFEWTTLRDKKKIGKFNSEKKFDMVGIYSSSIRNIFLFFYNY